MQEIIAQINDRLQTAVADLATAKEAAAKLPEIEGEIAHLREMLKIAGASQTPAGRKRIGEAQRKRRVCVAPKVKGLILDAMMPAAGKPPAPLCSECRCGDADGTHPITPCEVDGCEAKCHEGCAWRHGDRWHAPEAEQEAG